MKIYTRLFLIDKELPKLNVLHQNQAKKKRIINLH